MKSTLVLVVSALSAAVLAQRPELLNSNYVVTQGEPFTLQYRGCQGGCTILLKNGNQGNLINVSTLATSAPGATGDGAGTFVINPDGWASDTYAIEIQNNVSRQVNYSPQFTFQGTGVPPSSASTTAAGSTSSVALSTTSASVSSTASSSSAASSSAASSAVSSTQSASTSVVTPSVSSATTGSTSAPLTTTVPLNTTLSSTRSTASSTGTRSTTSTLATTTIPGSAGSRASSPMALVAGAVAAMAYFV